MTFHVVVSRQARPSTVDPRPASRVPRGHVPGPGPWVQLPGHGSLHPFHARSAGRGYSFNNVFRIRGEAPSWAPRHRHRGPARGMSGRVPWARGPDVLRETRVDRVLVQSTGGDHRVAGGDGDPPRRVPGGQRLQLHATRARGREGHRGLRGEGGGGGAREFQRRL